MESCRLAFGSPDLDADGASFFIVRRLWERLRLTHLLVVVQR